MKTLLVLAQHPDLPEAVRAAVAPEQFRVLHRTGIEEAEPILANRLADACIVDVEHPDVQAVWLLEKLRRKGARCPVIVFTGARQPEWEEEVYLRGAVHVLPKPVRGRMLSALLDRLFAESEAAPRVVLVPQPVVHSSPPAPVAAESRPAEMPSAGALATPQAFGVLRGFSGILTHSLDADAMLREFLLLVRELLSVNRAAIFLRQPVASFGGSVLGESRRLRTASSVGLSTGLLEHFELSFDAGIGAHLVRHARILRRYSDEARTDAEAQKEFELLGAQVAVPILDREAVIGVAVFDGRITGEPLVNSELEMVFHLLEHLGLGIRNIWLHEQLAGNHRMMAEILRELSSACVVISRDLVVLHANKAARKYFARAERRGGDLEFSDLPQLIGTKVFQVLRTGSAVSSFRYEPENAPGSIHNVSIVPFQTQTGGLPASALLMIEDLTQSEQLRRLEMEAAGLRLLRTMADRLTHEIGNALVPLSVHQQMLAEKLARKNVDAEFLKIMERDLGDSVRRVTRFASQMRFLARDTLLTQEAFPVDPLIQEAYDEARRAHPAKAPRLEFDPTERPIVLTGDRAALRHALAEVMLNALQANPTDPKVGVRLHAQESPAQGVQIEVQDNGTGFSAEVAEKASTPFFTTRNVGLGLGLTVSRKIIENHHGKLEIVAPQSGSAGLVRISLPTEAQPG